ncbi:MAG TPA: MerR family transcriptional regulator, partial [Acidimicrobiales bacterium]|nr:MerR family transcriptional regulator [Acidimicrobiales bacterium]
SPPAPESPASTGTGVPAAGEAGLRIGDAAARAGVSTRTLRYYDELGLLSPSQYTSGGERRYRENDLAQLGRILELREVLGMNLEEIKRFLDSEQRLDEVRAAYRAEKARDTAAARTQRKALLREALALNESLEEQLQAKLVRMESFRATLAQNAQRCREVLAELD